MKLGQRAIKMVFLKHSKVYVMYGEHPNGGMMKLDSYNVDVLEDAFPSISEIMKTLSCMSYNKTFNHLWRRERI